MNRAVFWFRSDLRLTDNLALHCASKEENSSDGLVAIFVISKEDWIKHDWGPVKVDFIRRNLKCLEKTLSKEYGIPLIILEVDKFLNVPNALLEFMVNNDMNSIWFNNEPEWDEVQRDNCVEQLLTSKGIKVNRFQDQNIVDPAISLTKEKITFKVYTPYKNGWLKFIENNPVSLGSDIIERAYSISLLPKHSIDEIFSRLLEELQFSDMSMSERMELMWPAGYDEAKRSLNDFIKNRIGKYKENRDYFYLNDGTSALSPYLSVGVISARECFLKALSVNEGKCSAGNVGICAWISELIWREFFRYILYHFPHVSRGKPFKPKGDDVAWRYPKSDPGAMKDYERWCNGLTGYPIVDAAMRYLNANGWLHNRLRMIVASFLVFDLGIDWRMGEKFFMKKLIDGDFASNNGAWQYGAGIGTDPQKLRIFNPTLQCEKFDPNGDFIRKWVPEIKEIPTPYLFEPWKKFSSSHLIKMGYRSPICDHAKSIITANMAFRKLFDK